MDSPKTTKMSTNTIPGSLDKKTKKHFLEIQTQSGNVDGVGRGVTGFATRSDSGSARDSTEIPMDAAMQPPGPTVVVPAKKPRGDDETEDLNDANYDEVFTFYYYVLNSGYD